MNQLRNWRKKEKKDSKDFNAKQTKGSGNQWYMPGDSRNKYFLFDSKFTKGKGYRLTQETWDKIYEQALFSLRTPALSIQIQKLELVVLSKEDFIKLAHASGLL